jgi:hypothetical protein
MELEQVLLQNNNLMLSMLQELRDIRKVLAKEQNDFCTAKEALELLGLNNIRYLTYFFNKQLLQRRKGGKGFLYYKDDCKRLSEHFKNKTISVPNSREIYN